MKRADSTRSGDKVDHNLKNISENVLVMEKEHKNASVHRDLVTGIWNLNEQEFLTCGVEHAMKIWDKSLQSCDYTIETHKPLYTMAVTGERSDIMIAALGSGDLIVFGLSSKNQLDIVEQAHQDAVVQIVSLQKLKNKYFATRCVLGHVNIWSATAHPDRLFTIENIDRDEATVAGGSTSNHEVSSIVKAAEESNYGGSSIRPPNGPLASDRDRMIELKYKLQNQSSSTVLCFSNYNESQIILAIVDLKTRRKNIIKTFKNQRRPTYMHQIDESNLLVGTEGGLIEHWSIDSDQLMNTFEAHTTSDEGVSSIIELSSQNYLLWGDQEKTEGSSLIASASLGTPDFRIWCMTLSEGSQLTLTPHMRIETSFSASTGIRYLLEASETQIVAVDTHRTLKFYEFIDKSIKEEKERLALEEEEIIKGLKELFDKYDANQNGELSFDEFSIMAQDFFSAFGVDKSIQSTTKWTKEQDLKLRDIFNKWDEDGSNFLTKAEMRPIVKQMLTQGTMFRPSSAKKVEDNKP